MTVAVPDFGALASQQQAANDDATRRTTWSNRPDQYNAMGTTTWNQDPSGRWIANQSLNGGAQGLFDSTMSGQTNLAGQVGQGLDYSSLGQMPQVGGYNQQVINAWNALQQPGLDQQAAAQRQRAAAMGLTLGSAGSNDVESTIGRNWNDASNKAILAGYQQGNTEFDQALRARTQGASELQNKFAAAGQGLSALTGVRDSLNPNKWNADVPTGAAYTPQTIYGAALDQFSANRQNENADIARQQATTDSYINALRAAGGTSGLSGVLGGVGSLVTGAGKAYDWAKDAWDSWNSGGGSSDAIGDLIRNNALG